MDGAATPIEAVPAKKKRPPGTLLFLPAALNRGAFIQWLKRIHAWTGFWGALMFLVIGSSGFLLNHRAQLKIETGEPQEVMSVVVPVDAALIKSPEDLGKWAQKQFNTSIEPRAARGPGGPGGGEGGRGPRGDRARAERPPGDAPAATAAVSPEAGASAANAAESNGSRGEGRRGQRGDRASDAAPPAAPVAQASAAPADAPRGERASFMGREVQQAPVWKQTLNGPNGALTVEYTPGANTVKAVKAEQNFAGLIKNMHKGGGMNWQWVLFIDTMAGGLVAMALTGALLWSRLHGPRLAALGIVLASIGLGLFAAWPTIL